MARERSCADDREKQGIRLITALVAQAGRRKRGHSRLPPDELFRARWRPLEGLEIACRTYGVLNSDKTLVVSKD